MIFFKDASRAESINTSEDFMRVKKWIRKICILYGVFSVIAIALIPFLYAFVSSDNVSPDMPDFVYLLVPLYSFLVCFGYATMIIYFPKIFKSILNSAKNGYNVGKNIETTHVQLTHEYANTYRVSSYTQNKGCLFAFINGIVTFVIWQFFCVYIGPFLTFKKIYESKKNIEAYSEK